MAADRFLDTNGLRHLWEKIKALVSHYTIGKLSQPTQGYRDSYILKQDGESIDGSDTINIPMLSTPLLSKEYHDDTFYCNGSANYENATRYFMSVTPNSANEYWHIKYNIKVWIPNDTTSNRFTDSVVEYFGIGTTMKGYRIWNTFNTGTTVYYQAAFWLTSVGLTNGFGHVLGTSIIWASNYTNSSWYRYVKVDLLDYEGCVVDMFDELTKWAPYKQSIGASSSDYGTTDPSAYNATTLGITETNGTDTSSIVLPGTRFTAGAYGIMNRSLIMQDGQGKWQSFTRTSGTGTSKVKNPSGFRIGSKVYYMIGSSDYAADAVLGSSIIKAFHPWLDFRYTLNITTSSVAANNLLPYKPIYIVGTIGNDGLFYLDDLWWTQDEPSTENGKIYVKVAQSVYNDYSGAQCYRADLFSDGHAYWYKDGMFRRYYDVTSVPYAEVAGSASSFGNSTVGSPTMPVYINQGVPTVISSFPEAYLSWGGRNLSGTFSPVDASLVPLLGENRFAFINHNKVVIDYSRDGGSTWSDYEATNEQKVILFSPSKQNKAGFVIGKSTLSSVATEDCLLRVSVFTDGASIYTSLNKFVFYVSSSGSDDCFVTIRGRTQKNFDDKIDTWDTFADTVPLSGWPAWNVVNTSRITTYGNDRNEQYGQIEFIFGCGSHTSLNNAGLTIMSILCFGGQGLNTPSFMASHGHIYDWDSAQNAIFPNGVRPLVTNAQDLGTQTYRWRNLYVVDVDALGSVNVTGAVSIVGLISAANGINIPASKCVRIGNNVFTGSYNDLTDKPDVYTKHEVDSLIDDISNFKYQVVGVLPTASESTMGIIYIYNGHRYLTVEKAGPSYEWSDLGSYDIDLTDYVTFEKLDDELEFRPIHTKVTESQMEGMIDNHSWIEGVLYYSVED